MTPFELYKLFVAIQLHFKKNEYDFIKYKGVVKGISEEKFKVNKHKPYFVTLSQRYDDPIEFTGLLISNIMAGKKGWVKYFLSKEARDIHEKWQENYSNIDNIVIGEIGHLIKENSIKDIKKLFEPFDGGHPLILVYYYASMLSLETLIACNKIYKLVEDWDKKIVDDVLWPETKMFMYKYEPFLKFELNYIRDEIEKLIGE